MRTHTPFFCGCFLSRQTDFKQLYGNIIRRVSPQGFVYSFTELKKTLHLLWKRKTQLNISEDYTDLSNSTAEETQSCSIISAVVYLAW